MEKKKVPCCQGSAAKFRRKSKSSVAALSKFADSLQKQLWYTDEADLFQ